MGNNSSHESKVNNIAEIQHTADIRIEFPLYKTEFSDPKLDYQMNISWSTQWPNEEIEIYHYKIPEEILKRSIRRPIV